MYSGSTALRCARSSSAPAAGSARTGRVIRHQPLLARRVLARDHHHFAHARVLVQPRLDLAELNAKAANLHLKVVAPQKLDVAIRKPAAQIPRAVHPRPGLRRKRITQKPLLRQLRALQIAPRYTRSANVQIPRHPNRYRLATRVQKVDLLIRQGAPVGYRRAARIKRRHRITDRPDRCLGRSTQTVYVRLRAQVFDLLDQPYRYPVPAQ